MLSPSVLNSTRVPRCWRICFLVRLIMPWRLPACADFTLPLAGDLEALFSARLGLQLGHLALHSVRRRHMRRKRRVRPDVLGMSVLIEQLSPPRQPFSAGRREGGLWQRAGGKDNRRRRLTMPRRLAETAAPATALRALKHAMAAVLARRQHHHHLAAFEPGSISTLAILAMSSLTRLSSLVPSSWCAISRPRKRSVILTLSPSSKKRCIERIFTS